MKKTSFTYRIIALSLAFLMFGTSVGFAVDMHYCKGNLKAVSILGKAKTCHEKKAVKSCPHHAQMQQESDKDVLKYNCCQNETTYVQADIEQAFQSVEFTDLQQFILAFIQVFYFSNRLEQQETTYNYYKPPLIQRDIPVLVQSFLL